MVSTRQSPLRSRSAKVYKVSMSCSNTSRYSDLIEPKSFSRLSLSKQKKIDIIRNDAYSQLDKIKGRKFSNINGVPVTELFEGLVHTSNWNNYKMSREVQFINNSNAKDPSWLELQHFLDSNVTYNQKGKHPDMYKLNEFMCGDFTLTIHNNAEAAGIRCGYVSIYFKNTDFGHALTVFKTIDRGWIFVDPTYGLTISKRNFFAQGKDYINDFIKEYETGITVSKAISYYKNYFKDGLRDVIIVW